MEKQNELLFGKEMREKMLIGINNLSEAVGVTLGPNGRNVLISRKEKNTIPILTKDGVTVAHNIFFDDYAENCSSQLLKEAAGKTNKEVGDGTTSVILLGKEMMNKGNKIIDNITNVWDFVKGMEKAQKNIIDYINIYLKKDLKEIKEICDIAYVSSNRDEELKKILQLIYNEMNKDVNISVQTSNINKEINYKKKNGYFIDKGYMSNYFINDIKKERVIFEDCLIFLYDGKIKNASELYNLIKIIDNEKKPLVIVTDKLEDDIISYLLTLSVNGLPMCVVKAPSYGIGRKELMEDIAISTNGKLLSNDLGNKPEQVILEYLGKCSKVVIDNFSSLFINSTNNKKKIEKRIDELKAIIEQKENDFERERLETRIFHLQGNVAVIYVGGESEFLTRQRKDRIEDAINAVSVAIKSGIVPGGGITLYRASKSIELKTKGFSSDFIEGYELVRISSEIIFKKIISSTKTDYEMIYKQISDKSSYGYDSYNCKVTNMFSKGVIDPYKVIEVSLKNAINVSIAFLTCHCLIK